MVVPPRSHKRDNTAETFGETEYIDMGGTRKPAASIDQPHPSEQLDVLRENLDLDENEWQQFLRHARNGFVDYTKAAFIHQDTALRLRDVPDSWWEEPEPVGYIFMRVAQQADADLAARVAWFFLQMYDPEVDYHRIPPGTGLAWLHLSRQGIDPPVPPAELTRHALVGPELFFQGINEDEDLLPACRLILEGAGTIQAWDVHAVIAAVDYARIHVRAPFRLFNGLMAADWIAVDVKREFCRGLLGCDPEGKRLREHRALLKATMDADAQVFVRWPKAWHGLTDSGVGDHLPTLRRHAVFALVETVGEPLLDVVDEFFLKNYGSTAATEAVSEGVLDLIGLHSDKLGPEEVRRLIGKAIKRGLAPVRQAAYRIGAEQFGLAFVRPALKDDAGIVRKWAARLLETKKLQPARKTVSGSQSRSTPAS
jgi:hypothetical protein